ncbi:Protein of unknown function [Polaromonas sp. OV174]|uniref:DUF3306 domain-containing protein n=1 Tax=Polaromonas sp. OV174 TaxID=1855300 RepID=UPI0008E1E5E7|nr:DUF3306 domain-containing protein [Polaromonas sp. OV174]SFB68983.1 Protein of unknown function [Polaromonas sp. OV174]
MAEEESRGFLGRWSRRKADALQGKSLDEPAVAAHPAAVAVAPAIPSATQAPSEAAPNPAAEPLEKKLSLDDVRLLTKDSDFKPFMASDVGPEVRNAAMKKLFADPHFNVMDGLDIYIDDYSKPDPLPESMLRQMASAKFLKLFDEEKDADKPEAAAALPRENANDPPGEIVAQSYESADIAPPGFVGPVPTSQVEPSQGSGASQEDHAHTDLRLQPDHAAKAPDPGHGT